MKIYNESEKLVELYQGYGLTAYVRMAKMTWNQDKIVHDIVTFIVVKDENNNTILELDMNNDYFWFYNERGYVSIVKEIEKIVLLLKYYYCKLDDFNKNKVVKEIFFDKITLKLERMAIQIKQKLEEIQIKNHVETIVDLLKDKYSNGNYRFYEYAGRICVLKYNKTYSQKDIDKLSAEYIIKSLEDGSLNKYINKDFEIIIPVVDLYNREYNKQELPNILDILFNKIKK